MIQLLLLVALQEPTHLSPDEAAADRESRTRPLTIEDAIYSIPGVSGRMQLVGDLDRDGQSDLVVQRGGYWSEPITTPRLDAVSSRNGRAIRTLWLADDAQRPWKFVWDSGGDVDADGVPDLLVGLPGSDTNGEDTGTVLLISGKDGKTLLTAHGAAPLEHYGFSVTFMGDLGRDGHDDYAVGAPQCDPSRLASERNVVSWRLTGSSSGQQEWLVLDDGSMIEQESVWKAGLDARSELGGFVSVCSGRDGNELHRLTGQVPGHAFGDRVRAVGDVNRDGRLDLLIGSDHLSSSPMLVVSGATAEVLFELTNNGGPFGAAGDVDQDGFGDLFLDGMTSDYSEHCMHTTVVSGADPAQRFTLPYPEFSSEDSISVPLGDVDGDGAADLLLGDANCNIWNQWDEPIDLRAMTLEEAVSLGSVTRCAFTWSSGAAWVYSGRTHEVIMGAWGDPGSRHGMGLNGCVVPDLDGDGLPEIAVVDAKGAHVFAGPGLDPDK